MALSPAQVFSLARGAGFDPATAVLMVAIAGAESGWNPEAVGDVGLQDATWGPSVGLWQVRSLRAQSGTGRERDETRLKNPEFNAKAAYTIFKSQGLGAWSAYTNGSYKSYLSQATSGSSSTGSVQNAGLDIPGFDLPKVPNAADIVQGIWKAIQPLMLTVMFAGAGLALIVVGSTVTTWPTTKKALSTAGVPL